ncbi:hypothetical protein [Clostridium tarantellae]|uniref:Uncharacterized protein n=1 Tax=Clostridium tarantellae TaxID=39493 RepID=A0A6I1MLY0_9CLOT|nr:hypothetical protein [Clostridium tarantellae]MPQ43242.1 hypothetical protein [Clostridium tarantellae]
MNTIKKTKEAFYKKRKDFLFWLKYKILFAHPHPMWLRQCEDKLGYDDVFNNRKKLVKEGTIALATIVQANELLFSRGTEDHPATMIYSSDIFFEENPKELERIAKMLFSLRNETLPEKILENKELMKIRDLLNDEYTPIFNVKIPDEITKNKEVYMDNIIIHRLDMPNFYLEQNTFPVVTHKDVKGLMALPSKFWIN